MSQQTQTPTKALHARLCFAAADHTLHVATTFASRYAELEAEALT